MTPLCNICGQPFNQCGHVPGREYEGVICVDPWANDAIRPRVWNADEVDGAETNAESVWQRDAIATIRDRDARIAEITIENSNLMNRLGESPAPDDTHRAEAFTLYNSLITRGWGDGDKAAFASRAAAAIEAASVFNEKWEKRDQSDHQADEMAEAWIAWEDLQRDHDALRAELEAANARIAELEAYKAGVEALPVRRYTWANGFTQDSANGRFIPAEEGE